MDTVLAEPALLGTLRQANPKGNDLKHCLGTACKTRRCAGGGEASKGQQHISLNPWGEGTNRMRYSSYRLARERAISVLQGKNIHLRFRLVKNTWHE